MLQPNSSGFKKEKLWIDLRSFNQDRWPANWLTGEVSFIAHSKPRRGKQQHSIFMVSVTKPALFIDRYTPLFICVSVTGVKSVENNLYFSCFADSEVYKLTGLLFRVLKTLFPSRHFVSSFKNLQFWGVAYWCDDVYKRYRHFHTIIQSRAEWQNDGEWSHG